MIERNYRRASGSSSSSGPSGSSGRPRRPRSPHPGLALTAGLVLFAAACTSDRREPHDHASPAPYLGPEPVRSFVAHRDARVDAPSFVWLAKQDGVSFASAHEAAAATLTSLERTLGLDAAALAAVHHGAVDEGARGPVIARLGQRANGVDVFRAGLAIAMNRAFDPVSASGFLARSLAGADRPFARSRLAAAGDAYTAMTGDTLAFTSLDVEGDYERFSGRGLAQPARVKRVLYPQGAGVLPAYYVELQIARGPAYSFVVSASDGRVLFMNDLVRADAFAYRIYGDPYSRIPFDGPQGNVLAPHPTGKPDGLAPKWGPTQLVTIQNYPFSKNDPWLPSGATTLVGNNVRAYPDLVAPDGIGGDSYPIATSAGAFDYPYDTTKSPGATPTNLAASATHLFYVTNFLHDWYYDVGFDEASGNHQVENFGRGGVGHDPLAAEAQDYSGRNNSNALVPADGASPKLQMFVFSGPSVAALTVTAPPAIAGVKEVGLAGFGVDSFTISGAVALAADDQGADTADACEPLTNNVKGKIVLVHRGTCSFLQKAENVQAAGGIGCVVANVAASAQPTVPPFMGGTSSAITLPILSLALGDGQALEAAVAAGATVQMRRDLQTDLDGALDTTIVAHEWGHVISGRLVGDGNGLNTNQAGGLGEGWADFSAQLLTVRADDVLSPAGANWTGTYATGAYATTGAGADFYFGIRRVPYSIDFTKDPLTLRHIENGVALPATVNGVAVPISFGEDGSSNAEVHSTGEVWASMLWECYAALLRDGRRSFVEAQETMKRYYVASLKLTPPDPTIIEARDAVLAAAFASDPADYRLFWAAFGRRGAGVGAEAPPKDSSTNQGVKESFVVGNDVQILDAALTDDAISCDHDGILDEGEVGTLSFKVHNAGQGALVDATATLTSAVPGVTFLDGATFKLAPLAPFATAVVKARTQIRGAKPIAPFNLTVTVSDPSFGAGRVHDLVLPVRFQTDEAPSSSAIDHVDTKHTAWVVSTDDATGTAVEWSRVQTGLEGRWVVPNGNVSAAQDLTSPRFLLDGSTFELAFKHRWSFRVSRQGTSDLDGGVVEVSVDKGATWTDLSSFGVVDYTTTLATGRGDSVLEGRKAYGNKSPGYPAQWVSSRIKVDLKTQPESVKVRFRTSSGQRFTGAPGWEVSDIALDGIASTPFWSFADQADNCDPKGPVAAAGEPRTVKARTRVALAGTGTHPKDLPLAFAWTQASGPAVALEPDAATHVDEAGLQAFGAAFVAPDVERPTTLTFALRADDGALLSAASTVDITVLPNPTSIAAGGGGCSTSRRGALAPQAGVATSALGLLALGALVRRRARRR